MPSFSEGIVLPAPSRADRKIQTVSKWHCTVHTVRGSGAGTRMQGESKLEADHQAFRFARPDVEDVVEQALFNFGYPAALRHGRGLHRGLGNTPETRVGVLGM